MLAILERPEFQSTGNMAEMIISGLRPVAESGYWREGLQKLHVMLHPGALGFFREWLVAIAYMEFEELCPEEYAGALRFWMPSAGQSA